MSLRFKRAMKNFNGKKANFTIDHILNVAGEKHTKESLKSTSEVAKEEKFEWLTCTRYSPPKLPRQRRKDGIQRRKPARNPRIPFSSSQVAYLEAKFLRSPYLNSKDVTQLASFLKLTETRVKIWFQNRRAREKRNIEVSEKTKKSPKINLLTPGQSQHSSAQALFIHNSEKNLNSFIHLSPFDLLNCVDSENNFFVTPLDLSERNFVHRTR